MDVSHEVLNKILTDAALSLDSAAHMVRDLKLSPETNIKKLGQALVDVFEIQNEIYALRPDLKPGFSKE